MKKYRALITAPYLQLVIDEYRPLFKKYGIEVVVPKVKERMEEEELLLLIGDVDGIICGDDRITERVLENAPRLKAIVKWGTGIDSINKEAANRRGIPVRNTVNAFTEPVADTVMSYILNFSRGTLELNENMHKGLWQKRSYPTLQERTLGVIGVGNIGLALIRRAQAFGMKVLGHDIAPKPYTFMVPLEKLLKESDFVSVNCDLNAKSRHLINKKTLSMMKKSAYLLNAARGPIVDEKALIAALKSKKIAGAGLDVFEKEPLPKSSPLLKMKNVILTPHNSNAGPSAWRMVHENSINTLKEELSK